MRRRHLLGAALAVMTAGLSGNAMAQSEIKIGEINSYSLLPAFTEPYRKGWQLAVEEINAAGGVNGKKLIVISKDDELLAVHSACGVEDRKSTRLNSSHQIISYAVFCLKKKMLGSRLTGVQRQIRSRWARLCAPHSHRNSRRF